MIVFDLACADEHEFEGWFRDSKEYQKQLDTGLLTCPVCGSENIVKMPSASHISFGKSKNAISEFSTIQNDAQHLADKIRHFINNNFEDVGANFTAEAKKIHYGEADERNIHGSATKKEVLELHEEGIETFPVPVTKPDKDKLN